MKFLLAVVAAPLFACASAPPIQLGTGDIGFRLLWHGKSDLDLHVRDTENNYISHQRRESPTGGRLDVDCNADRMCPHPVENIYWPSGSAPAGRYVVWAKAHRIHEGEGAVRAEVLILRGETIAERLTGVLASRTDILGPFEYVYTPAATPLR